MVPGPSQGIDDERAALEALLGWYVAMGVDSAIEEVPRDHFVQPVSQHSQPHAAPPQAPRAVPGRPSTARAGVTGEPLIAAAEELAAGAATIEELGARWAALPGCGLAATASQMIFAAGAPGSRLMLIAGAPDSDDERRGEAFCGAKGVLLENMLRAIGLDRSQVYLGHVVPWRPPGNRSPTPLELALCLPFAKRHITLAKPGILVCLGERAAQPLLGSRDPISRLRGRWVNYEGEGTTVKTLVTFSLDYLLTQPLQKRKAWADLQLIAGAM